MIVTVITCPACGRRSGSPRTILAGTQVRCTYCKATFAYQPDAGGPRPDETLGSSEVSQLPPLDSAFLSDALEAAPPQASLGGRPPHAWTNPLFKRHGVPPIVQVLVAAGGVVGVLILVMLLTMRGRDAPAPPGAEAPGATPTTAPPADTRPPVTAVSLPTGYETAAPLASPPTSGPVVLRQPSNSAYRYGWKPGQRRAYQFRLKAEIDGKPIEVTGTTVYAIGDGAEVLADSTAEAGKGTGTGFVVNSHGYLLTCAHVVENAADIQATINGRTLAGRVVALDQPNDLAVVYVAATGLPVLPLADSGAVEVAQEVRAVGYPLSDVLGESLKVTTGSVAGIVGPEKMLHVDASVNPGNSGGPLVLPDGSVVGVVNAKLAGPQISNVGFAVPMNTAKHLLRKRGIPFASPRPRLPSLAGPELAKQVAPSVAYLRVSCRTTPEGAQGDAFLVEQESLARVTGEGFSAKGIPGHAKSLCVVDRFGKTVHEQGETILPSFLGPLGAHPFVRFSEEGNEKTWKFEGPTCIAMARSEAPSDGELRFRRPGAGRRPSPPFPRAKEKENEVHPAYESTSYRLTEASAESWTVEVEHSLATVQEAGTPARFRLSGSGTVSVDARTGAPTTAAFDAALVFLRGGEIRRMRFNVAYELTDADAAHKAMAGKVAKAEEEAAALINAETLDDAIAQLSGPGLRFHHERDAVIRALATMEPIEEKRQAVADALRPLLSDDPHGFNRDLSRAVSRWGTDDDLLLLLVKWNRLDGHTRDNVVRRLKGAGSERAASLLAQSVATTFHSTDQLAALEALRQMGPKAEEATLTLLGHRDSTIRQAACGVLASIGGEKSVNFLMRFMRFDRTPSSQEAAKSALRAIRGRERSSGEKR